MDYRRAIANFVNIVTNRSDIKVRYQKNGDSYTDGKVVTIGSKIDEKNFDHVVGLALRKPCTFYYLTLTSLDNYLRTHHTN